MRSQASERFPVVSAVAYFLAHVPGLVRHGSKPAREAARDSDLLPRLLDHLREFDDACAYPPHQAFIGNLAPEMLWDIQRPWFHQPMENAQRFGPLGEIMPETEFLGLLKICDEFNLVQLEQGFTRRVRDELSQHPLIDAADLDRLGAGMPCEKVQAAAEETDSAPLFIDRDRLVGCVVRGHEEDSTLTGPILLENLSCKASGTMALRRLLAMEGAPRPDQVEYVLGCGEEASGDRYQRGGGSMAKAIAAQAGCLAATGSDLKAYCCSPVHALVLAGATLQAGLFEHVAVVGGGAMAKLGMKFQGHLKRQMPVLEDVLASVAVTLSSNDGRNPVLRLDAVGRFPIGASSGPQVLAEHLVARPLERLERRISQVDRIAPELHDPDITEPAGSGNVPHNNYRILGSLAVLRGEISVTELADFERQHGMPGFSPTQGHIASAIPFLGHARKRILEGQISSAMFVAKGSLFLGRMTQLSDGMSVLLERNCGGA